MNNITLNGIEYTPVKAIETPITRTTIVAQETPEALDVSDVNNVVDRFKELLNKQNIKGINEYGVSLTDAKLSLLELVEQLEFELVDSWQYLQVIKKLAEEYGDDQTRHAD